MLKLGLMVPLNNTTMERELLEWMPAGSTCRTLKIPRGEGMLDAASAPAYRAANVDELGSIASPEVARLARETMRDDCDALFIACSQLPTRDIVEPLQRDFGRPVWSSIQATAWQTRRVLA